MQNAAAASRTKGIAASTSECTAIARMPIAFAVRMIRRAISPRVAMRRDDIMTSTPPPPSCGRSPSPCRGGLCSAFLSSSHPEQAEARVRGDRGIEAGGNGEAEHVAGLDRVDDPVVPQPGGGVVRIAFVLVALADRGLE